MQVQAQPWSSWYSCWKIKAVSTTVTLQHQHPLPLPCSLAVAWQSRDQRLHYQFPAPSSPWPLDLPTYLFCDPLPGLQAAGSSSTKQFMVMRSASTATSMSLQCLALWRHCASLQAQGSMCHQELARAGIPPPLIPSCMHTVPFSSWTHTCVCSCSGGASGCPRCAAGTSLHGVQSGGHT